MRRPRVLVLTTYYPPVVGGVEQHARAIALWLLAHGYEPRVLTTRVGAAGSGTDTADGVPVRRVRPAGVRRQRVKWLAVPFLFAALVRLRGRFDVVYCPDFRGVGLAAVAACRLLGKRLVVQATTPGAHSCATWDPTLAAAGIDPGGTVGRALKRFGSRLYSRVDASVCLSREAEREARASGIPEGRIVRVPGAADLGVFTPASPARKRRLREELGLPDDRVVCLFLGRLSREKGLLDLLDAWRRLDDERAFLLLVGPEMPGHHLDVGPEARAFVKSHGLGARVRFFGGTDEPARFMRAADVFVSPSHYEGFGTTFVEAMACGLALVVSPVGGITEYLAPGRNAVVCEPGAPRRLAEALSRVVADEALRLALGRAARATAERHFDWERVAGRIAALLREVAGPRGGAAV